MLPTVSINYFKFLLPIFLVTMSFSLNIFLIRFFLHCTTSTCREGFFFFHLYLNIVSPKLHQCCSDSLSLSPLTSCSVPVFFYAVFSDFLYPPSGPPQPLLHLCPHPLLRSHSSLLGRGAPGDGLRGPAVQNANQALGGTSHDFCSQTWAFVLLLIPLQSEGSRNFPAVWRLVCHTDCDTGSRSHMALESQSAIC